jgi:translation elongation factor EF-1alpha
LKNIFNFRIGFGTKRDYSYSIIDTPGSLYKNCIRGITLGDICVLFISADVVEFKDSLDKKEIGNIYIPNLSKKQIKFLLQRVLERNY